jgi:hypothetical protein
MGMQNKDLAAGPTIELQVSLAKDGRFLTSILIIITTDLVARIDEHSVLKRAISLVLWH